MRLADHLQEGRDRSREAPLVARAGDAGQIHVQDASDGHLAVALAFRHLDHGASLRQRALRRAATDPGRGHRAGQNAGGHHAGSDAATQHDSTAFRMAAKSTCSRGDSFTFA